MALAGKVLLPHACHFPPSAFLTVVVCDVVAAFSRNYIARRPTQLALILFPFPHFVTLRQTAFDSVILLLRRAFIVK